MSRLHKALLRLLPRDRREHDGVEIARVFAEQRAAASTSERIRLWVKEVPAIVRFAIRDHRSGWSADLRNATRNLRRSPAHLVTSTICLAVGLSATITIFSVVNTMLWGPLPGIANRDTLSRVYVREAVGSRGSVDLAGFPPAHFEALGQPGPSIAGIAGQVAETFVVHVGDDVVTVAGSFVSGGYFRALGTTAVIGRVLTSDDDANRAPSAVVSEAFWRRYLGASRASLGRLMRVGDRDVHVVGVVPARFPGISGFESSNFGGDWVAPELWLPLSQARDWPGLDLDRTTITMAVRHAPGVDREQVAAALAASVSGLHNPGRGLLTANIQPLGHFAGASPGRLAGFIAMMLAGPLVLLAIGCANAANLQLARSLERTHELSVRLSLGAGRGRVIRLVAVEAAVTVAVALAIAWLGTHAALVYLSPIVALAVAIDWRVVAVATTIAAAAAFLSGVLPAWLVASRLPLAGLRYTSRSGARPHARLRHAFLTVQVALSVLLLVVGALFGRTVGHIDADMPNGARELLVAKINLEQSGLDEAGIARFAKDLTAQFEHAPRVVAAGVSSSPDLFRRQEEIRYLRVGDDPNSRQFAFLQRVSPGFFGALSLRAAAGRTLTDADRGSTGAVINAAFAQALASDGQPVIGRSLIVERIQRSAAERARLVPIEIVGVVPNEFRRWERPHYNQIYLPLGDSLPLAFTFYVRADDPVALTTPVRRAIATLEPRAAKVELATALDLVRRESGVIRFFEMLSGVLGVAALLLASAGLYAVVAFLVSLRTREMGLRMAIGATPNHIAWMVVRQAIRLVSIGSVLGLGLAIPLALTMRSVFVAVSPFDPRALLPTIFVLLLVAVLASIVPARRAARIDPVASLRGE